MLRRKLLFLVTFFCTLVGGYALIAWNPVNDTVIVPFTKGVAAVSGVLLRLIGEDVTVSGTVVASPRFAVNINNGCNGVEATLILLAAVVALPAPLRARISGLILGALLVQVLNQVRVVTLYLLGVYRPLLFDVFHTAVWQIVIIGAAVLFFLVWSSRVVPPRLPGSA